MRIKISGVEYSDLEILSEAEIPLMNKLFGKPKHVDYDGVLGDSFNSKFIGYIPDGGGELQKPAVIKKLLLSDVPHTRKVFNEDRFTIIKYLHIAPSTTASAFFFHILIKLFYLYFATHSIAFKAFGKSRCCL